MAEGDAFSHSHRGIPPAVQHETGELESLLAETRE
jgi:hypothetical protein